MDRCGEKNRRILAIDADSYEIPDYKREYDVDSCYVQYWKFINCFHSYMHIFDQIHLPSK